MALLSSEHHEESHRLVEGGGQFDVESPMHPKAVQSSRRTVVFSAIALLMVVALAFAHVKPVGNTTGVVDKALVGNAVVLDGIAHCKQGQLCPGNWPYGIPCPDCGSTDCECPHNKPAPAPPAAGCSNAGDGCLQTGCCNDKSLTCFKKNNNWADCKATCSTGVEKYSDGPWSCEVISNNVPAPAPPAAGCSNAGDGCLHNGCCNDKSLTCFKKNTNWADCKATCTTGVEKYSDGPWSCEVISNNVPAPAPAPGPTPACSGAGNGCLETGCCVDYNLKCFKKNNKWADCKATCTPGAVDPNSPVDQQSPWSCEVLKPPQASGVWCDRKLNQRCPGNIACPDCGSADGHCKCAAPLLR